MAYRKPIKELTASGILGKANIQISGGWGHCFPYLSSGDADSYFLRGGVVGAERQGSVPQREHYSFATLPTSFAVR